MALLKVPISSFELLSDVFRHFEHTRRNRIANVGHCCPLTEIHQIPLRLRNLRVRKLLLLKTILLRARFVESKERRTVANRSTVFDSPKSKDRTEYSADYTFN